MLSQKTEWGHIDWFHMPEPDSNQSITVGFTELLPGKNMVRHVHYGQEQFIYILTGSCTYTINGKVYQCQAGDHVYIEPDSMHETVNTGTEALHELVVSNSVLYRAMDTAKRPSYSSEDKLDNAIYGAVESIRASVLDSLRLPMTILDSDWKIVWQGQEFPEYCHETCHIVKAKTTCPCLQRDASYAEDCKQFLCPHGLTVFHEPVLYNGHCIGVIRGGQILLSDSSNSHDAAAYDTPRSYVIGIQRVLQQVVNSLLSICELHASQRELSEKSEQLQLSERNLITVKEQVTNLKINHHFLFNTLNSMAEMSLTGDRDMLYDAIVNLAKMFRYTMATELRFVPLSSELEYLDTYLGLQKLRYREQLEINFAISSDVKTVQVPFNFLQPIVENAFVHGFSALEGERRIWVDAEKRDDVVEIRVTNNGSIPDDITVNRVRRSMAGNTGHGLSLIYEKLKSAYGDRFTMDICTISETGVRIIVTVPLFPS